MVFFKKDKGPKMCPQGHIMNPEWDECLICRAEDSGAETDQMKTAAEGGLETKTIDSGLGSAKERSNDVGGGHTKLINDPSAEMFVGELVGVGRRIKGDRYPLKPGKNIIGSGSKADIPIADEYISEYHASIRYDDGKFFLTDLDSSNGTFLNGSKERLVSKTEIKDKDIVAFVDMDFKLRTLD